MARRRSSPAAGAAGTLLNATSTAGALAGLFWATKRPLAEPAASCSSHAADAVGKCFGDSLTETFMPYVIGAGVGLLGGALLAFALVIAAGGVRRLRQSKPNPAMARVSVPQRPVVSLASATRPRGRSMRARYSGACSTCGRSIRPGDQITHVGTHDNRCTVCA